MNRLADASSPYLRQHRDNPVHWYQWGDDAFAEAQRTGKPILLSVGYSACHWCHVMAHESFEDDATATVMNQLFVNVKVDREERPDVDAVYMDAVQALTGRGGWPMTVFCTPTGEPFYGGTYYPRETFVKLMEAVDDAWRNRRDELQQNVDALVEAIGRTAHVEPAPAVDARQLVSTTIGALQSSFDATWGGFSGAPKCPSTFGLDLMLRVSLLNNDTHLVDMVRTSLDAMAAGGMYDHIGG
ncbi:MAG: thioredoxin domain-containing protein, partial [Acidimicrobiaceae bacterium]